MPDTKTLYDRLCDRHVVTSSGPTNALLYADLHVLNEYTSPQAFAGLVAAGRGVRRPCATLAVVDHVNSTRTSASEDVDDDAKLLIRTLTENCSRNHIQMYDLFDPRQGIEHVVVPERGLAWPGMVIVCGDSHTTTLGALGALAFGIGTSDVEHVLATQTVVYTRLKSMRITISGRLSTLVSAKDVVLAVIDRIGADGANGYAVEFAGTTIDMMSVEGRMTLCNMAVEGGARAAIIAPDEKVFAYLEDKPGAPRGDMWDRAVADWRQLRSGAGARFDREVSIDVDALSPLVTWGTSPEHVVPIDGHVPDPASASSPAERASLQRALDYMGLTAGTPMAAIGIDRVFIGSCTNARIEDLRVAATVARGGKVADGIQAMVIPGSREVKRMAEAEGIDRIFLDAGFEWRESGCSMCLAMNDDIAAPGERCASSTNRNFEGRQGQRARTHLMSPAMAAAAALTGRLTDVRQLMMEQA